MKMQYKTGFCGQCNAQRKVERAGTNHWFHLIMTILTFGLWIPIWICVPYRHVGLLRKRHGWRCSTCGSKEISKVK